MLSPSCPAQKNLSEEDSSGSDAGSEISLEPETDRFGFIVTNGSTVGSLGPSPELVRQREAKWINIIGQWDRILLKKSSKVKVQCQKGIPASLRAKCWPLLCGATDRMKQNDKLYKFLDSQPGLQSWVDVIERDLDRQFPFHEMFLSKDGHGQRGLFRVLKAYTQFQPEEGYCQAQGPVAAVLLMNMPAEEAFWCLVQISEQYLPGYYSPLLEGVLFDAAMLTWVLKKTCPAAHKHLQRHEVEPLMFATDWLMCLFTRHLPFNTLLRVWDLFFCYGVRVLLQVAVVLVRRVLGRAEQRKLCQGQMETLERLRGIREQIQEEDDTFIAEVCSVPLSARDLEKHMEKELEKWRKDRPSSTFDPRGRCQGYRMAWAKVRENEEERDRKAREKGNLSVPLARSASTLSLSPSLLHKRWRKGGKANTNEWEGSNKVVRHLSMGAKEDWRGWTGLDFKVQSVQEEEDVVSGGHSTQSESKLIGQNEQKEFSQEPKKMDKTANILTEHEVEPGIIKEQFEKVETGSTKVEERQLKEIEESKISSDQKHETNPCPTKDQTTENHLHFTECTSHCEQEEKLDAVSQSQVQEEESHKRKDQEIEIHNTNEETEKHVTENEHTAEDKDIEIPREAEAHTDTKVEMQQTLDSNEEQTIQADMKPEVSTETENMQDMQANAVSETRTEIGVDLETDRDVEASTFEEQNPSSTETETQQEQEDVITETDKDAPEGKYHSSESLAETEETDESHTQTKTGTDVLAQTQEPAEENAAMQDKMKAEIIRTNSEKDTKTQEETLSSPECIQEKEGSDLVLDTEAEAEIPLVKETTKESNEAKACEPTEKKEEIILTVHSEVEVDSDACICGQTVTEKTPKEPEVADSVTAAEKGEASTQDQTAESDLVQIATPELKESEQPTSQANLGPVEEGKSTENGQENPGEEDDVFTSTEPTVDPHTDNSPQVHDQDFHSTKDQFEHNNSGLAHISGHCSSRSSGDFCVRKSSNLRGSRLARKLSEDLFISPQKSSQSQFIPNHAEVKHPASPGDVNPTQIAPDVTLSTEEATIQQGQQLQPDPRKRFGLFRRLRGEQPKNSKTKETPKIQVPKILIQDFSDMTGTGKLVEEETEEKLSSRERRRRRRERERREKEEEKLKKKRENKLEKERERERKKPQTRGKSFQVQKEKVSDDVAHTAKTGSQTLRYSASYAESYF